MEYSTVHGDKRGSYQSESLDLAIWHLGNQSLLARRSYVPQSLHVRLYPCYSNLAGQIVRFDVQIPVIVLWVDSLSMLEPAPTLTFL